MNDCIYKVFSIRIKLHGAIIQTTDLNRIVSKEFDQIYLYIFYYYTYK